MLLSLQSSAIRCFSAWILKGFRSAQRCFSACSFHMVVITVELTVIPFEATQRYMCSETCFKSVPNLIQTLMHEWGHSAALSALFRLRKQRLGQFGARLLYLHFR